MKDELIRFAPLFAGLTDQERDRLSAAFAEGESTAQTMLLRAGERSSTVYLIEQGFVSLTTPSGANLATLGPGSLIGEASLFRDVPQDVNATALSDLKYWQLTDRALRDLIMQQPSIGLKLGRSFGVQLAQMEDYLASRLAQAAELAGLPSHTLHAVAARLQPREVQPKEAIYRAGEAPLGLFLLEHGAVELRADLPVNGDSVETLTAGALFGALPLLTGKPYSQTAVATQPTLLWTLSHDDFVAVSAQHPGLRRSLARNARMRLNKSDQAQAVLRLGQISVWGEAAPQTMQAVAQRMVLQHVPAGERVYMMGEAGDALYLIESGEVELTSENASGALEVLARIGDDGHFGERGVLTGQIRTEDATATRNTNLWVLYKSDLDALAAQHPEIGKILSEGLAAQLNAEPQEYGIERFRQFNLLAELGDPELGQVVDHLHPMRYRAGEQIFRASSPAEMLYLLERGHVRMQPLAGGHWLLGPGETFGERALLNNQPHNASAVAETDVDVWTLSKQDFDILMARHPMLAISMSRMLSQRMEGYDGEPQAVPSSAVGAADPYFDDRYAEAGDQFGFEPDAYAGTNIPSRRRRNYAAQQPVDGGPRRQRPSIGQWFSNLSTLGKVQLAVLLLLLIWLIGIAAPAALLNLLQGTSVARSADMASRSNLLNAINAVYAVGSYELAFQNKDLAEALAMADQAVPPTPTYTPVATSTPIPTATPLPTNTPTPVPTSTPAPTVPAFVQPLLPAAAVEAPEPAEPVAQVAAAPPRAWDPRLDKLGVTVEEANAQPGQQYWRLVEARWADEQESGGKHHIYVEVLDENGQRLVNQPVTVYWGEGSHTAGTEDKAPPDYGYNYQMYAAGNAYHVKVEGLPSDILHGAGMGDIERPQWGIHTSFYITYQRATR